MKKQFGEYYLGLDIGTNSVGWAVTDLDYNILKFNQKAMWGVRKFDEASTAAERRQFRTSRRRLARRKQRMLFLRELFEDEINKVDPYFFLKLNESKYHFEDRSDSNNQEFTLFNDSNYKDSDFFEEFPTIYHLRLDLIRNKKPRDVRLVFLALNHMMKSRGHFLFPSKDIQAALNIEESIDRIFDFMAINHGIELKVDYTELEAIISNRSLNKTNKKKNLIDLVKSNESYQDYKKQVDVLMTLLAGGTGKFSILLNNEDLEDFEFNSFTFSNSKYDEISEQLEQELDESFSLIYELKQIYDWSILVALLKDSEYISESKVKAYEKHRNDLELLKKVLKHNKDEYKKMFSNETILGSYTSYVGDYNKAGKRIQADKKCLTEDFYKYVKKALSKVEKNEDVSYILGEIDTEQFMPKQRVGSNGVIPYQLHLQELKEILINASSYLPFLNGIDKKYKITVSKKIEDLFTFRIPYYVGPLNGTKDSNYWLTRKSSEKITPWNFSEVVDVSKSAESFITRMTNNCTYLMGEDVLPKGSLLYGEFMVLNELNNLKINDELISVDLKNKIFEGLFMKTKKVTAKALRDFLVRQNICDKETSITGFDGDFKSSLSSYIDFEKIIGSKVNDTEMVENIIRWITLFGESQTMLKDKIKSSYGDKLDSKEIDRLVKLKISGWGRISEKLLKNIGGFSSETGEVFFSIIEAMHNTNENLMQLLGGRYTFSNEIEAFNNELNVDATLEYEAIQDLALSPSVKRQTWQALQIVKEIVKITGHSPKKLFVEVARKPDEIKKRTISRRQRLIDLYSAIKDESRDWVSEIGDDDKRFQSDRLFFYYTQMGKCMYTGEKIDLSQLYDSNIYDIDHIYPQSVTKDDSLNNRCLVLKSYNSHVKKDIYPLNVETRNKQYGYWKLLFEKRLIDKVKFERLVRSTPLTDAEKAEFIARQVVETRQTTKIVASILTKTLTDSDVVYVKANNVSEFRQENDFVKVREINDLHHAKDAYLNIVVGNVYDTKFSKSPLKFIQSKPTYSLNRVFTFDVERNGVVAWKRGKNGSIQSVEKTIKKNNILVTNYSYEKKGGLFDQTIMRKGKGQHPIKASDSKLSNIQKYGGYNKIAGSYFCLVEYLEKNKKFKKIIPIPVYLCGAISIQKDSLNKYIRDLLDSNNFKILIERIKMKTIVSIDGFQMNITGRMGERILLNNANQLVVSASQEKYIKAIVRAVSKFSDLEDENKVKLDEKFDKVNGEDNIQLYDLFVEKLTKSVYSKKLSFEGMKLVDGRNEFMNLSLNKQVIVLSEILKVFQCDATNSKLTLINQTDTTRIRLPMRIQNDWNLVIIHQSVTGLFEQRVKINDL